MSRIHLGQSPIGTPHNAARCCWCARPLVVAQVPGLVNIAAKMLQGAERDRCWLCPVCYPRQLKFALVAKQGKKTTIYHIPLPSQVGIYESTLGYLLWGGRAGPGKSAGARWWLYYRSLSVPGHVALILRENLDQLAANHTLAMDVELPLLGGRWIEKGKIAAFGAGSEQSLIYCGHMAEAESVTRYTGIEYGAIVPDEASLYPLGESGAPVLAELSTRARLEFTARDGTPVSGRFMPVTNPGGPTAPWLRAMFKDKTPDFEMFPALRPTFDEAGEQTGGYRAWDWGYVDAALRDNPYTREDYKATVLANLSEVRYKQLAEGNWEAFVGAFFPEWNASVHVRRGVIA